MFTVFLSFGNAVRADTVLQALPASFGVLFCKPVPNKIGAYRYLVHIGQEDKAQYDLSEVVDMAGFSVNLSNVMNVDFGDVYQLITELEITSFSALLALLVEHKPEYLDYVTAHVNLVKSFVNDYARHTL
ncbi:Rep family protein [Adlercreutzia aquisgranensis]|uniref:Rep family protein n=1 Tax=Adlercreutzia aquisgranensis TaxID=2941323 RepID=UPI00203AF022|nr:Rep family protein [Adlercreutzia aquisgranensis]